MNLFLITLAFFTFFIIAMAIGVIFGKRRLKGSCGGIGNCAICGNDSEGKLEEEPVCLDQNQIKKSLVTKYLNLH